MLKYIVALAVIAALAVGSSHCGFSAPHHHGSRAPVPDTAAV